MRVAGLQLDLAWEDPSANFARAEEMAKRAASAGARLIVLPEMFATGFTMNSARAAVHADETLRFMGALAKRTGAWIVGGFVEPHDPRPLNGCALFDPRGKELLRYHKIHPFTLAGEERHYCAGEAIHSAAVEGVRVTPFICYDLRFPEIFRHAAEETDLFVVIANWPEKRSEAWKTLLRARAIEAQCFVLGVNRVGVGGGLPHQGDSALLDPLGKVLDEAAGEPAIVAGEVDASEVAEMRSKFTFLADRREELYRRLDR
ncbi:MAG: carbon-nitrogen hydrolase [Gemmatimonadetes bacterium]|nr:carbon-nitrogen hydrolase [Gemmatimonadota bacterium]